MHLEICIEVAILDLLRHTPLSQARPVAKGSVVRPSCDVRRCIYEVGSI